MAQPLDGSSAVPVVPALSAVAAEIADRRAVARARAGHPEAFEELVRRHARGLLSLCSRLLNDGPLGEDMTQEAFARAYARLSSFRGQGTFRHWLYTIAANGCRDYLKAGERAEQPCALSGDELRTALDPERGAAARQALSALLYAVATLPPACRNAFVLFHIESLSYEEMSQVTGVGISALKVRVHRARQLLRRRLGELVEAVEAHGC
ncbi:MAG TPA: sigma-70 family RNA polymerase sigma factor [Anaeromyxobacter sp.]|nr:sigma-70 family RNA polymerase sigma factor [Anaeromyxobacter sp.]HVO21092.1 sigma-70 family RNA polymerase sigma factor [Anaeromyxobacter sp.]